MEEKQRFLHERRWIERRNAQIQEKKEETHADVYDQVNVDLMDVVKKYDIDLAELLSQSRTRVVAAARAEISMIALERLRPLGISDGDIAKFLGLRRTTMLFAAERWGRENREASWEEHHETKERETND